MALWKPWRAAEVVLLGCPKSMRQKLVKVKDIINSVISQFRYILPKWDFLPEDPKVAHPWEFKKAHGQEIETI